MQTFRPYSLTLALQLLAGTAAMSSAYAAVAPYTGVVIGPGGARLSGATVCFDNGAGRCDSQQAHTQTDANGRFTLHGHGGLVAVLPNGSSYRAPVGHAAALSAISTELQALMDGNGGNHVAAEDALANRLGVAPASLQTDFTQLADAKERAAIALENEQLQNRINEASAEAGAHGNLAKALRNRLALDSIRNVVVIYAENRAFNNLYGTFPGANGIVSAQERYFPQKDRDGVTVLPQLPPAWGGLTAPGQVPAVSQAATTGVWPNAPFQIDSANPAWGANNAGEKPLAAKQSLTTRDLYHRFFENQMQINGGKNDMFVADGDAGGLVMGYYDGAKMQMWNLAKHNVLADNFFQGAFGGSFLNHQYLVCACAPSVSAALVAANKMSLNTLDAAATTRFNGVPQLLAKATQSASALDGATAYASGNIAPLDYFGTGDGYRAVNTMQPAYQPSGNPPAAVGDANALYANPAAATTLPPQTQTTIGDLLTQKNINWAWYSGGWRAANSQPYTYNAATGKFTSTTVYYANSAGTADDTHNDLQAHHQPFNYFSRFDPNNGAAERSAHLKDYDDLVRAAQSGTLPSVAFYKPDGYNNQHAGYASVAQGDEHIAKLVAQLQASPQWKNMLVVITYDENGGFWDHVAPPKGDLLGPGTRIPALLISSHIKSGTVDHTAYDTASVLRFITHRFSLPVLPGLQLRDDAVSSVLGKPMGDLTNALSF